MLDLGTVLSDLEGDYDVSICLDGVEPDPMITMRDLVRSICEAFGLKARCIGIGFEPSGAIPNGGVSLGMGFKITMPGFPSFCVLSYKGSYHPETAPLGIHHVWSLKDPTGSHLGQQETPQPLVETWLVNLQSSLMEMHEDIGRKLSTMGVIQTPPKIEQAPKPKKTRKKTKK